MTTFAELVTLTIDQTRRPEVPAVTHAAVRAATLRAHHVDFFPRDLSVSSLSYTPSSSAIFYDFPLITTLLPRLRTIQVLQSIDSSSLRATEQFEYREVQDLYDSDNCLRPSVYTLIGDTLRVYPQIATGALNSYYYQNPVTTEVGFSSWIVDTYPDEVAMWAAAIVFARTGFAEMAADFQRTHIQPFKELLLSTHLQGTVN